MKTITNFLFSFALVRAFFINCVFIKASNDYYLIWFNQNWDFSDTMRNIRYQKLNIQEVYYPEGQHITLIRCINKECNHILNIGYTSYTITYSGDIDVNEYNCSCCGKKQWFISDEINDTRYYLNCDYERMGDISIKNHQLARYASEKQLV